MLRRLSRPVHESWCLVQDYLWFSLCSTLALQSMAGKESSLSYMTGLVQFLSFLLWRAWRVTVCQVMVAPGQLRTERGDRYKYVIVAWTHQQ